MRKSVFVDQFEELMKNEDTRMIQVYVEMPSLPMPEMIRNPRENFEAKLKYYKNAYNDDMELNTFNGVKIIGILGF
jgi:hypothetical protein